MTTKRRVFIEFDKAGAEWVVVAYLSGDARMLEVIEQGKKPHAVTGSLISGVPEEIVLKEHKAIGGSTDPEEIRRIREESFPDLLEGSYFLPRTMSIYQAGKKSNHGLNYNMMYKRFALENEIEEAEAKRMVNAYKEDAYPGIPVWHETVRDQLRRDRTLINCFGRKRTFLDAWGTELFDAAYSYLPQSTVFDITRIGIVKTYYDESPLIRPVEQLAQVHDSVLAQVLVRDWRDAAQVSARIGLDYFNPELEYHGRTFHIGTTAKIGPDWGHQEEVTLTQDIDKLAEDLEAAWERANERTPTS